MEYEDRFVKAAAGSGSNAVGNLLQDIRAIRFGDDANYVGDKQFQADLIRYQKFLIRTGRDTISPQAILGWFGPKASLPRRLEAIRFLHGYLLWMSTKEPRIESSRKIRLDKIIEYTSDLIEGDNSLSDITKKRQIHNWRGGRENYEKWRSIEGLYQIIRPYTSDQERFVLEAMSIEAHRDLTDARLSMYSHNQPEREFMYSGELSFSGRNCFGTARRIDDEDVEQSAIRCIVLQADFKRNAAGYVRKSCLSGIMLRGVKSISTGGMAISMPFVALRSFAEPSLIRSPTFIKISRNITKLSSSSYVIIGDVDKRRTDIFEFCKSIFARISSDIFNGITMQTVKTDSVEEAIVRDPKSDTEYYEAWIKVLNSLPG